MGKGEPTHLVRTEAVERSLEPADDDDYQADDEAGDDDADAEAGDADTDEHEHGGQA